MNWIKRIFNWKREDGLLPEDTPFIKDDYQRGGIEITLSEQLLEEQLKETHEEILHLESVSTALDIALTESDLSQIKEELTECGYIKKHYTKKKKALEKSKPLHYISSDGYHIYVGKNNYQNEELTFKFATGNDWWFHAKKMAGSHVIVKSNNE